MEGGKRRLLAWAFAGVILAVFLAYAFWPRAIPVDLAPVTRGPVTISVSDEGRTRIREIFAVSAPVEGRLLRVEAHPGDKVIGGETVVARLQPIDPTFLDIRTRAQAEAAVKAAEAALALAAADVKRARAELQYASAELARKAALAKTGAISRSELDRARLAFQTREAEVATADAAHHVKEHELDTAKALLIDPSERKQAGNAIPLLAPASGRILRVIQESESAIQAGTPIMEVGDPSSLEIEVELLTTDAVAVRPGARALITGWGGGKPLHGAVRLVEPFGYTKVSALGIEEQRVRAIVDLTDSGQNWDALGHGFRVDVSIITQEIKDAIRVPLGALFRDGESWAVFKKRGGQAQMARLDIGPSNDTVAVVKNGIEPGDSVVLYPSDRVSDGVRIAARR